MIIRQETQADIEAITEITKAAFENHPFGNNTEQFIVNALRAANVLTISLVAQLDGKLAGHIAFSPVTFSDSSKNFYGLGPISVLPDHQRQGIGTSLVNQGISMLKDSGAQGCLLVGDPKFYQRFGFRSTNKLKYESVPQKNLLVLPFSNQIPQGTVKFHRAFSATR